MSVYPLDMAELFRIFQTYMYRLPISECIKLYKLDRLCHFTMTAQNTPTAEDKKMQLLEEICENTRAIRRVANRILDYLHEFQTGGFSAKPERPDPDEWSWDDLDSQDDMFL